MFLKKEGFPEEEELVLCTVTNVQHHSVFVTLDEYGGRTGMIHISEIAPGRIRNIREFVVENKKVVCKVLQINPEKGHIDLSLRRVNEMQKREKQNQIKQEQLAEKIIENLCTQKKQDPVKLYKLLFDKISQKYGSLYQAFEAVVAGETSLEKLGVEKELAKELTEVINQRIKPKEVSLEGEFSLVTYEPNGLELIKEILKSAKVSKTVDVRYKGAGLYRLLIKANDYKKAEKLMKTAVENVTTNSEKNKIETAFKRLEKE